MSGRMVTECNGEGRGDSSVASCSCYIDIRLASTKSTNLQSAFR